MNAQKFHRVAKPEYLLLLSVMALAFYLAFLPHHDYPYPVHIDEWVHLALSKAMLQAGSTTFVDPFLGQSAMGLSSNLEAGFHLFWGVFQRISGLSWLTIFRYFPSIIFVITVLSVYTLARREGFGWEAALFASLIPTTVGILGPAFLVPVAMGLIFIPLSVFIAFNFRSIGSYLTLFVFTSFLLAIHAPSALSLAIILIPYIVLNVRGNFKHSLALTLALGIPFIAPFPWIFDLLLPTAKGLLAPQPLSPYVEIPRIIATYGHLTILLSIIGICVLALRGGKKNYGLALGLLAILVMLSVFFTLHLGVEIVYQRGLMAMMLMLSIVAGACLAWVKSVRIPMGAWPGVSLVAEHGGKVLCLVLITLTLVIAIPARQGIPYYHMIDKEDYEAFVWIGENVGDDYETAILDPWKATAFTAITGKQVFSRIHSYPKPSDNQAYAFLKDGASDTTFLKENGIPIVYTRLPVGNPDLTEVRDYVYLLKIAE